MVNENLESLKEECEKSVNDLFTYMAINRLAVNDDKTKILAMKYGRAEQDAKLSFQFGRAVIKESESEKLLGMTISKNLDWTEHISSLESKLRFRLFTLRRMEQVVPKSLLKKVADGIFCSILRFGLGIFCPVRLNDSDPNPSSIEGVKVIFHDVLRLLCSTKRSEHSSIESMLEKLNWLSVNQLAAEIRLMEVWKSLNLEDYCLKSLFQEVDRERTTRSTGTRKLKINFKTKIRESSFHYQSVRVWNSAPEDVTNASNESQAKSAIRRFVLSLPV